MTPEHEVGLAEEFWGLRFKIVKSVGTLLGAGAGMYWAAVHGGMDPTNAAWLAGLTTIAAIALSVVVVLWLIKRT